MLENVKKNSRLLVNTCLRISAWAFKTSQIGKPKRHMKDTGLEKTPCLIKRSKKIIILKKVNVCGAAAADGRCLGVSWSDPSAAVLCRLFGV